MSKFPFFKVQSGKITVGYESSALQPYVQLKFIYSEKATKFCEISTNYLTGST